MVRKKVVQKNSFEEAAELTAARAVNHDFVAKLSAAVHTAVEEHVNQVAAWAKQFEGQFDTVQNNSDGTYTLLSNNKVVATYAVSES